MLDLDQGVAELGDDLAEPALAVGLQVTVLAGRRLGAALLLLARDPALINSLNGKDYSTISARLIGAQKEIGAASIRLLDNSGRTVGATDRPDDYLALGIDAVAALTILLDQLGVK